MDNQSNDVPTAVELRYAGQVIGHITDVFFLDDTWFGSFRTDVRNCEQDMPERVMRFIEFCQDWNNRVESNPNEPPDPSEFDQYSDLLKSGLWSVKSAQGDVWHVAEAPVFSRDGDVSWRTS
jgi:hypothetical protein